ncbi:MAG: inositol monophosphatase, partial [Limisphaerales bacterium]
IYFKVPKPAKGGGSLWDFAATACVLEEWGTPASDVFGRPLDLNRAGSTFMNERGVIYASDNELREAVQQIYRQYVG